jgi:glycosyltransferase involved in cell wall biosynthesis
VRIVWAGTYVPSFERNKRLAEYLAEASIEPEVVRASLWPEDRVQAFSKARVRTLFRMLYVYPLLFMRLLATERPDLYLVSYPGWFDVPVVKLAALIKRRPVVFDVFISLFDTAITDRNLAERGSFVARVAKTADRVSIRLSDRVIADCMTHARFLAKMSDVGLDRFGVVYLGADETIFHPLSEEPEGDGVLFYGNFVPLQGTDVILRAAARLDPEHVQIRMVGRGQTLSESRRLAEELGLQNVKFLDRMSQPELVAEIGSAAICLGIFGSTPKADRVVPHKLYEAIACGRPVISGDSPALREVFPGGEVVGVPSGSPDALAKAISALLADNDRLKQLAHRGYARFHRDFAHSPQSARLVAELSKVVNSA